MIFVDSNIWCYYFDASSKEHKKAAAAVDKYLKSDHIVLNTPILMEVAHYLIKNLGAVEGKAKLLRFLEFPSTIIDLDFSQSRDAIDWLAKYTHVGIGGRDATILSSMNQTKTKRLLTHDKAFARVAEIEMVDPV